MPNVDKIIRKIIECFPVLLKNSTCLFVHIAAIFHGNDILSIGINQHRNNSILASKSTIHAEMDAIERYFINTLMSGFTDKAMRNFKRKGLNMVVLRITEGEKITTSMPCSHCAQKLYDFGIKKIYWSDVNGEIQYSKANELLSHPKLRESSAYRRIY